MAVNKLEGANDLEKLGHLCSLTYKQQAVWFLNAFWDQFQAEAPKLWKHVQLCADLDSQHHAQGTALDELNAHRFLEQIGETLTVVALRERLRKTGAIGQAERPKAVPLTHYILWRYEVDWHVLVNTTGDNSEEIEEAQRLLDSVVAAFQEAEHQAQLSRQAEAHAKAQEAEARAREEQAKQRESQARDREAKARDTENQALAKEADAREQEAPFKAAQEEVDAALADVNAQESARDNRTAELQRKSTEGGIVQQNKAKAELAQHLAEDPLPLRKAKITLEAALKRAEKARAPFEAATQAAVAAREIAEAARHEAEAARREAESARQQAEAARQAAEESRRAAEAQRQAAEDALAEAGRKVEEAEAYLAEVKAKPGTVHGAIWWMEKELEEQKKYLPSSKGGVAKRG